jgi:hypothetical protein
MGKHSFVMVLVVLLTFSGAVHYVTNLGNGWLLRCSKLC